jgi:exonuclease VII large subunit
MANQYFQQARDAIQSAQAAMNAAHTPEALNQAYAQIHRAKQALSQAFADSSMAEREQLGQMQEEFYDAAESFSPEDLQ